MVTFALLALIPALLFLYFLLSPLRNIKGIPRPPGLPILGHALNISSTSDIIKAFTEYVHKCGDVFQVQIGLSVPFLVVASPKAIECILGSTKHLEKSEDYNFLHSWLGTGLVTSAGNKWKKHRRIITPTFHFKVLEDFVEVFNSTGDILMNKLRKEVGKASFDIVPFFSMFALDAICESAMGVSINAQQHPSSEYVKSVKDMCRIVSERGFSFLERYDIFFRFTNDYAVQQKALEILHGFSSSVIKKRRQQLVEQKECDDVNEFGIKKRKAFLDLLLEFSQREKEPLTDEELMEEADTFMFAGHDTTSTTLSFASYCLAENPHIQKIAYEEQVSIFGDDMNRSVTFQDLQNMPYLEMVLKETLRTYASIPVYSRQLSEEITYEGVKIPKGIEVVVFAYGVHRDPSIYPDPEKFDPERFAGNTDRSPYAYIPFSAGSRNCIGQKYAMLEMKTTLSKLIRNFEIIPATPKHELELAFEIVLISKTGIRVALKAR